MIVLPQAVLIVLPLNMKINLEPVNLVQLQFQDAILVDTIISMTMSIAIHVMLLVELIKKLSIQRITNVLILTTVRFQSVKDQPQVVNHCHVLLEKF